MQDHDPWRELFRSDELDEAVRIVTSIAAMEYDARLRALGPAVDVEDSTRGNAAEDEESIGGPPYIVEVPEGQCAELAGVFDMIVDEQDEFDAVHERESKRARFVQMGFMLLLGAIMIVLWLVGLLKL